MAMTTVLVAYDISADSTRAQVSAMLQAYGERVQESVFMCDFEADVLVALEARVLNLLNLDSDALLVLPLCKTCLDKSRVAGRFAMPADEPCWCVFQAC